MTALHDHTSERSEEADATQLTALLDACIPSWPFNPSELEALVALQAVIDAEIAPQAAANDERGRYPTESIAALKRSGILHLAVPKEFGGVGSGHRASLEAQLRLAMADSAVAQLFKVHDELVREIFVYCPPELREPLAARIVNDDHIIGLAVAEAGKRVDTPWTTVVTPTDDGYSITGEKIYTTGAAEADEIAVWAFNPTAPGVEENPLLGFQLTLVAQGSPGLTIHRDWDVIGQRATDSGSLSLDGVTAPRSSRANLPGKAPLPQNSLRYQAGFSAVLVGIGLGALKAAAPFVQEKSRPWPSADVESATDDPMVRRQCGELVTDLAAAYHATMATGGVLDRFEVGEITRTQLAIPIYAAKAAASRAAMSATSQVHALMGTRSAASTTGFDRWWRNARTLSLHDPVDWKHEEIGRHVLTGWDPPPGIYT
jgi:alkylation response protein AidB-like acyl-CoA dehydrogenase